MGIVDLPVTASDLVLGNCHRSLGVALCASPDTEGKQADGT